MSEVLGNAINITIFIQKNPIEISLRCKKINTFSVILNFSTLGLNNTWHKGCRHLYLLQKYSRLKITAKYSIFNIGVPQRLPGWDDDSIFNVTLSYVVLQLQNENTVEKIKCFSCAHYQLWCFLLCKCKYAAKNTFIFLKINVRIKL